MEMGPHTGALRPKREAVGDRMRRDPTTTGIEHGPAVIAVGNLNIQRDGQMIDPFGQTMVVNGGKGF